VCDVAIGAFVSEISLIEGSRRIITSDWARQRREHEQPRWAYLFDTGIVSKAEAQAWADEVWTDHQEEQEEESDPQAPPRDRPRSVG
jgi:hypothetical protein